MYHKASSQNVVDFLLSWEKRSVSGFSSATLCREFGKVCSSPVSELQIGGILSTLNKKGIVHRLGRGLYRCVDMAPPKVELAIPTIERTPVVEQEYEEEKIIPSPPKCPARLAIEEFLDRHSSPDEDFAFTIDMVAKEYPKISRSEIGKSIQNMHHWSKNSPNPDAIRLEKAEGMGNYIKKAKVKTKAASVAIPESNELLDELLKVLVNHAKKKEA